MLFEDLEYCYYPLLQVSDGDTAYEHVSGLGARGENTVAHDFQGVILLV